MELARPRPGLPGIAGLLIGFAVPASAMPPQPVDLLASPQSQAPSAPTTSAPAIATATYSIDYHLISTGGGMAVANGCVRLSGTIGQVAPGYSSGSTYWLAAGFWAVPDSASDEIFFNGFQRC